MTKWKFTARTRRCCRLQCLADKLNIKDNQDVIVHIKRLPPSFSQKGIIEYPRNVKENLYIDIFIKYDAERYITLAHEMVHLRQVITDGVIDENGNLISTRKNTP